MIIGIGHKKRHGKSTIAKHLVRHWSFQEFTFAAPIKEIVDLTFSFPENYKYDKEKIYPRANISYRTACQTIGESFRQLFGPYIWVNALEKKLEEIEGDIIISDVRHSEEANWIRQAGGCLIKVFNPNIQQEDTHISENGLDNFVWDWEICNDGSIKKLELKIDELMPEIFNRKSA